MKNKIIGILSILLTIIIITGCEKNTLDLNDINTVTFGDLSFEIPKAFEKDENNSNDTIIQYDFSTKDKKNLCMLYFSKSDYVADDLKEEVKFCLLNNDDISYSTKNINGIEWTTGYLNGGKKRENHCYVVNHNNKRYEFQYSDFGSGDLCEKALNKIESSLRFN